MKGRFRFSFAELLGFVIVVLLVVYTACFLGLYNTGQGMITEGISEAAQNEMSFYVATLETQLNAIREQLFANIDYNAYTKLAIRWDTLGLSELYGLVSDVKYRINTIRLSNPLVDDVVVYFRDSDKAISSKAGYKSTTKQEKELLSGLLAMQWDHNIIFAENIPYIILSYPYAYGGGHSEPIFSILVSLDLDAFYNSIAPLASLEGETAVLSIGEHVIACCNSGRQVSVEEVRAVFEKDDVLLLQEQSSELPITIERSVPVSVVKVRLESYSHLFAVAVTVILLVMLSVCLVLVRYLLRPLRTLSTGMERVREGDFSMRVPDVLLTEINELGHGFNSMAEEVSRLIE